MSIIWTSLAYDPENKSIQLDSSVFYLMLLPPIIFQVYLIFMKGGYSLHRITFFQNIIPILGLALVGGFYSTFVIATLMYGFAWAIDANWSFIESLVFGSLISSTDPVTVLSLLPSNVDKRLYIIIFGESALNDAVAIILYRFFIGLQEVSENITILSGLLAIVSSCGVFLGSFVIGILFGLLFAKITKHVWIEVENILQ